MDWLGWLVFLGAAVAGSYVQAVTGFAMGMIVIAVVGATGLVALPALTAAVSLISLLNVAVSLRGHTGSVQRSLVVWMAVGQIPATAAGVVLLDVLDRELQWLLQLLLGGFLTLGSLSMLLRPAPAKEVSRPVACVLAGAAGGLIGGLFAASGPVIGWFNYRQPLPLPVIRATLLTTFALSTGSRTVAVGLGGGLTGEVMLLALSAAPLVLAGAWLGREKPPPLRDETLKRLVFGLLLLMGGRIIGGAL